MNIKVVACFLVCAASAVAAISIPALELQPALEAAAIPETEGDNLVVLAEKEKLNALLAAAKKAEIANVLAMAPELTLFGPTDEAFDNIPKIINEYIAKNATLLKAVLLFHVIKGKVFASAIKNELLVPSILDPPISIRFNIYGKVVTAQCSPIVKVNLNASNGVLHELSRVMIPPILGTVTQLVVKDTAHFSTLVTAVTTADLAGVLDGPGPFTVFAPTNKAFGKIDPATLAKILKNKELLTKILKYHVVSGTFCSAGLADKEKVETLAGIGLTVHVTKEGVAINDANVVFADTPVTNGVVHVIDTVLIPKDINELLH